MIVIGIDIGVTGALTAVDSRGSCQIRDLPTQEVETKAKAGTRAMVKRRLCPVGLMRLLREFVPAGEFGPARYEAVHSMPGASGPSWFRSGASRVTPTISSVPPAAIIGVTSTPSMRASGR